MLLALAWCTMFGVIQFNVQCEKIRSLGDYAHL